MTTPQGHHPNRVPAADQSGERAVWGQSPPGGWGQPAWGAPPPPAPLPVPPPIPRQGQRQRQGWGPPISPQGQRQGWPPPGWDPDQPYGDQPYGGQRHADQRNWDQQRPSEQRYADPDHWDQDHWDPEPAARGWGHRGWEQEVLQPRHRAAPWIAGGALTLLIATIGVLGFGTPGFFVTKVFDQTSLQRGVAQVLTGDYGHEVGEVSCPAKIHVTKGATFSCDATVDGTRRTVPLTVTSDAGDYEVGRV